MAGLIILDTNVISVLMGSVSNDQVTQWFKALPLASFRTTAINVAEIRYGIARLPEGKRKQEFRSLADKFFLPLVEPFPFDHQAALRYAEIAARRAARGFELDGPDTQIAAIASVHNAVIATRNVRDFAHCMVKIVNPWELAEPSGV